MSTFRYDTKFRGATTNKGAIKLAPKFVNCPTCGFVRSKDRSKVIAKKSKQYHLFMPPDSGNEGTYYYIAYDGKPEERFDNSTGFDITCSSIESYSVKFDRGYGSDNFIIIIDNGTKAKSISASTQLNIFEDAGNVFIGGGVPIIPEDLEITFEDGDSISFNVYTEEKIRPAKYNISFPANPFAKDAVKIEIIADNKTYNINVEKGYDIYFNTIQSIKHSYSEDLHFTAAFLLNNGTKIKSVEPADSVVVDNVPTIGQAVTTTFEGTKNITVTFEDNDVLTIPVINEVIPKIYKYELTITNPYRSNKIFICADNNVTTVYQKETRSIKFNKLNYITYRTIKTIIPLKIVSLQNHTIVKQEGFTEDLGFKKEDGTNHENYIFDEFIKDDSCIKRCITEASTISKLYFSNGDVLDIPTVYNNNNRFILFEIYKTQTTKYIRSCSNTGKYMYYYMYRLDLGGQALFEDEYIIDNNNNAVEDIYIKPAVSYDKIDSVKIKDFSLKSSTDPSITIENKDGEKYIKIPKNISSTIILTINYYYYGNDTTEDKEFTIFNN